MHQLDCSKRMCSVRFSSMCSRLLLIILFFQTKKKFKFGSDFGH